MQDEPEESIEIPYTELSDTALYGLIESFVLREGTDYGEAHHTLADKVRQVLRQLARREARIVFDPGSESVDIVMVASRLRTRPQS